MILYYIRHGEPVVYPRILQLSNDSHLYKEGILRQYNNAIDV